MKSEKSALPLIIISRVKTKAREGEKKLQFGICLGKGKDTTIHVDRESLLLWVPTLQTSSSTDDKGFCRAFPLSGVVVLTMAGLKDAVVYTLLKTLLAIFYVVSHVYDYLSYPVSEDKAQVQVQLLNLAFSFRSTW